MFIRYQTARNLMLVLGAGGIVAAIALGSSGASDTPIRPVALAPLAGQATAPTSPPSLPSSSSAGLLVGDDVIIAAAEKPVPPGNVKDAFRGKTAVKVNIYDDDGDGRADRLKVDRNRDDIWDESWTKKKGVWERGDGTVWQDGSWRTKSVAAQAPTSDPTSPISTTPTGAPLDPLDATRLDIARLILTGNAHTAKNGKVTDYTNGRGPKFNLYDDDKDGRWDRAKADYDRDDVWDENWTRKGNTVERKDLKTQSVLYLDGAAWKTK